jgi:cysteine desulfurase / selenocysteine lyase
MNNYDFSRDFCGTNIEVPTLSGRSRRYVNFDNAASTPCLLPVWQALERFRDYYSSVHRGTGYKSLVSTEQYDLAHEKALQFVGADPDYFTAILVKNTSEAVNKLARRLQFKKSDIVLVSGMEHHSNDLPWRNQCKVVFIEVNSDGYLLLDDYAAKLAKYKDKIKMVSVTGASNVSGILPPIHQMAALAHKYKIPITVDAAQLVPHRQLKMGEPRGKESIDFTVYSAHKMYAPFGTGVLIGPKKIFEKGAPDYSGGGTVNYVTRDDIQWAHLPDKDEAGSPNVFGAVALRTAIDYFEKVGYDLIASHERELTKYTLERLKLIPHIEIYGPSSWNDDEDRLGVIAINVKDMYHAKAAAILSYEHGIGVRNGCFCAHPYLLKLLKVTKAESERYHNQINRSYRAEIPGMVRLSFGLYNNTDEIDVCLRALESIYSHKGNYIMNKRTGVYTAEGFEFPHLNV